MTPDSTAWDANAEAHPPLTDQDIRRRERLKALFLAHYAALYTFARSCGTHEPADAKDAIQITFHRLLKKRGDLLDDPVAPATQATQAAELKQYLYSSIRGRMLNGIRNENIHDRILTTLAPTLHPASLGRPDEDLDGRELAKAVQAAFALLSPQERRAIRCVRLRGMTITETAALMGISIGTVQVYLGRATQKLARALAPWLSPGDTP